MQNVDGLQHEDMDMVQADYMEGLKIVRGHYPHENVCILWLGSSVGNLSASAAVQFFRDAVAAVGTHCQILLCAGKWLHAPLHSLNFLHPKKLLVDFFFIFWGKLFLVSFVIIISASVCCG
jgi:hypothetical protein